MHAKEDTPTLVQLPSAQAYSDQAYGIANRPDYTCPHCEKIFELAETFWNDGGTYYCQTAYELAKAQRDNPSSVGLYTTRAQAFEYLKTHHSVETHMVSFLPSTLELKSWKRRERERFESGEYIYPPWHDREKTDLAEVHFAHLSLDKPGMIAFTPDPEAGITDKQTRITPGRYLERFYADWFSTKEIANYVSQVSSNFAEFKLATSVEDIRKVYRNGPCSCMGGPDSHTSQYWTERSLEGHMPCEVYASPSDLAVAYFGSLEKPSQRSVVWPEEKRFTRIYGTGPLERLLIRAGYNTTSNLDGARIRNISVHGGYLMPYVDGSEQATVLNNRFLRLEEDGELGTQTTNGYVNGRETARCEHCHDETDLDELSGGYCESCCEEMWTCSGCNETLFGNDEYTSIGDNQYCESCIADHTETCQDEHCHNTWITENEFTRDEIRERERRDLADLCRDCADRYSYCETCETAYDDTTCPSCERSPRCEKTADLFDGSPASATSLSRHLYRVATRYAVPRAIDDFVSEESIPLSEAIQAGQWKIANASGHCLIHSCHCEIRVGDVFLQSLQGFGYCQDCIDAFSGYLPPPMPDWTESRNTSTEQIAEDANAAF